MAQGWAYIAYMAENNPWSAVERTSAGYLRQEAHRLINDNPQQFTTPPNQTT